METQKNFDFSGLLRGVGLKVTPRRLLLLETLRQVEEPLTASEVEQRLSGKMNGVTVYRALEALVLRGIVRKVDTQHAYTHYELVATKKHHHHAICEDCGRIEDVLFCLPKSLEKNVLDNLKGFSSIGSHSLEFIGKCTQCSR